MSSLPRGVLPHKRIVAPFWLVLPVAGLAAAGPASNALKQEFSVPGKEGWKTNVAIAQRYGTTGGETPPLVPVVTLPAGRTVTSPGVRAQLAAADARLRRAVPGGRLASYASTGDRAFVSRDGRTVFAVVYPPRDPKQPSGGNPKAEKRARAALRGLTVAGAPVHLSGFDALQNDSGGGNGPGVFLEAVLCALGALVALGFVFASLLAVIPLLVAIVSIMTTFLLLY